jgi:hypothetical protein
MMRYLICAAHVPLSYLFDSGDGAALVHITRWAPSGTVMEYDSKEDWQRAKEELQRSAEDFANRDRDIIREVSYSRALAEDWRKEANDAVHQAAAKDVQRPLPARGQNDVQAGEGSQ